MGSTPHESPADIEDENGCYMQIEGLSWSHNAGPGLATVYTKDGVSSRPVCYTTKNCNHMPQFTFTTFLQRHTRDFVTKGFTCTIVIETRKDRFGRSELKTKTVVIDPLIGEGEMQEGETIERCSIKRQTKKKAA